MIVKISVCGNGYLLKLVLLRYLTLIFVNSSISFFVKKARRASLVVSAIVQLLILL